MRRALRTGRSRCDHRDPRCSLVAAVVGAAAQGGMVFALSQARSRLHPAQSAEVFRPNFFRRRELVELAKSRHQDNSDRIIAWKTAQWALELAPARTTCAKVLRAGGASRRILYWSATVALVAAGADYAHKRYEHETELRMTRQEFLDQLKQDEGNPQVKRAIRNARRKRLQARRAESIRPRPPPWCLTNPTHFAVALRYRRGFDPAPLVVAKGAGENAQRINFDRAPCRGSGDGKQAAGARAVQGRSRSASYIPRQFYRAIAEVLAHDHARRSSAASKTKESPDGCREHSHAVHHRASELALPATAMLVLAGMVAPVGATVLDVMLSLSLALSIVVLVVSASNRSALDFSAFPTVLLIATLLGSRSTSPRPGSSCSMAIWARARPAASSKHSAA